jgi:hypothetical protein
MHFVYILYIDQKLGGFALFSVESDIKCSIDDLWWIIVLSNFILHLQYKL